MFSNRVCKEEDNSWQSLPDAADASSADGEMFVPPPLVVEMVGARDRLRFWASMINRLLFSVFSAHHCAGLLFF